jgi:hypothetical protein
MRIIRSILAGLLLLSACSKSRPEKPPQLVSGEVGGVKFSVEIPGEYQLTSKDGDAYLWMSFADNKLFKPSITIRKANEWPADVDQLRRWVLRSTYEILRLEKLPDGYLLTQKTKDNNTVEIVVYRAAGDRKLYCSGEAGRNNEPLRNPPEEINRLLEICSSLKIGG